MMPRNQTLLLPILLLFVLAAPPDAPAQSSPPARTPLDAARILAGRYPEQPIMSYIPALSWDGALRLAAVTGDRALRDKPLREMAPFWTGQKPAIAEPYLLTSLAGHLAFASLAARESHTDARALAVKAADFILPVDPAQTVSHGRGWTDDMFMASAVWSRVAALTGDRKYADAVGRLLTSYSDTLQRPDGLFIHATGGPHAWGRGNGFAAFGLMEALTALPPDWPAREPLTRVYRRHMEALRSHQDTSGMWHQVVDEPSSYPEVTVTAMSVTAMARGLRLGWLDASYRPVVDRAWQALMARMKDDGALDGVCAGTGVGPSRQYYLDRPSITGVDDRGGAMVLTAALEMMALGTK